MTTAHNENKAFTTILIFLIGFLFFMFLNTILPPLSFNPGINEVSYFIDANIIEVPVSEIHIFEVVSGHAYQKHGEEVNQAVRCLNNKGSARSFRTSGFVNKRGDRIPTNLFLCFDGSDWYAIITSTFQKMGENRVGQLVTAYRIATDIFPTIDDFISYVGLKWNARIVNYVIQAGDVLLQPK